MITDTQYALLVGVPTAATIFAVVLMSYTLRRFLRIMHSNFDRIDRSMEPEGCRSAPKQELTEGNLEPNV